MCIRDRSLEAADQATPRRKCTEIVAAVRETRGSGSALDQGAACRCIERPTPTYTRGDISEVQRMMVMPYSMEQMRGVMVQSWWSLVEKVLTRIHIVGQLGGLITVGILITQICKFIWRLFKLYL